MALFSLFAATCKPTFLGLIPWYQYLTVTGSPPNCSIPSFNLGIPGNGHPSDIGLVLAALVDDLLRIAGIVAVAYVLIGAIKYVASQGSPDATASAQGTIINALIGLALAMAGIVIVSFLGSKLGG